jgi:KDO2-lipid IV(A) lauroyltransferase
VSASVKPLKRLKRWLRFVVLRALLAVVARLPFALAVRLGETLGALAFTLVPGERQKALASLATAFPELPDASRLDLARRAFRHLGRSVLEVACVDQVLPRFESFLEWPDEDRAILERVLARKKGVVFVTGHIGNWELMGWRVARAGYPVRAVAKELTDERLTRLAGDLRARGQVKSIWRGQPGAVKEILRALKAGELLTLLIDQDTRVQNVFVPFFGRPAATPRAAADFALRTGAIPMVAYCHRQADGRHRIHMKEVDFAPSGDDERDAVGLTAAFTRELEAAIRQAPEQWVWMHQRWKTRPQ